MRRVDYIVIDVVERFGDGDVFDKYDNDSSWEFRCES